MIWRFNYGQGQAYLQVENNLQVKFIGRGNHIPCMSRCTLCSLNTIHQERERVGRVEKERYEIELGTPHESVTQMEADIYSLLPYIPNLN